MNIFISGGAGFIGSNTARYYLEKGDEVVIFDNFSRAGSKKNLKWLNSFSRKPFVITGNIQKSSDIKKCDDYFRNADAIIHLAGQVAVTTSVTNPVDDFESNAFGTLQLLERVRYVRSGAKVIFASTNKVYGLLEDISLLEKTNRYVIRKKSYGISESQPLSFHSPYGCSKGSADQYMHDYARIYGLDTVVFRQSCVYGPRQFGIEDQGWIAWFIIAVLQNREITIYGDGKQVRDVLAVEDLICAYDLAIKNKNITRGQIYNIGGGNANSISIWKEFSPIIERLFDKKISVTYANSRPGDQALYISDIRKAKKDFGWEPKIDFKIGITRLYKWITENKELFV